MTAEMTSLNQTKTTRTTRRQCILVLGMHRSGTSAATRLLNLLGAEVPTNLLSAGPGNERGYWESQRIVNLHNELLAEIDSRWNDWSDLDLTMLGSERLSHYQAEIARFITEEFPDSALFVVKDPRVCRLVPLWRGALAQLNTEIQCALPFRHPFEVAQSLERRGDLPFSHGCLLWLRHLLEAERETRSLSRTFIHYPEMLDDPEGTASRVASELAGEALTVNEDNRSDINSSIDPSLRHHVEGAETLNDPTGFYPWLRETYEAYGMLVRNPADDKAQAMLDHVNDALNTTVGLLAPALSASANHVGMLESDKSRLQEEVVALQAEYAATKNELQAKVEQHVSTIRDIHSSTSWRVTAPLRATKRMSRKLARIDD